MHPSYADIKNCLWFPPKNPQINLEIFGELHLHSHILQAMCANILENESIFSTFHGICSTFNPQEFNDSIYQIWESSLITNKTANQSILRGKIAEFLIGIYLEQPRFLPIPLLTFSALSSLKQFGEIKLTAVTLEFPLSKYASSTSILENLSSYLEISKLSSSVRETKIWIIIDEINHPDKNVANKFMEFQNFFQICGCSTIEISKIMSTTVPDSPALYLHPYRGKSALQINANIKGKDAVSLAALFVFIADGLKYADFIDDALVTVSF